MARPLGPFKTKAEREAYVREYVIDSVRRSEEMTQEDRARWAENENLFAGKMNWGQDDEGADWMSRVFVHEYAPIIREMATAVQQMIFSRDDFISLVASESQSKEVARIREKLIRYYIEAMEFPHRFAEFCIVGGIYGFACWKSTVSLLPVWKPEVILQQIEEQEAQEIKKARVSDKPITDILLPGSDDAITMSIQEAVSKVLGGETPRRTIASKKRLELCMKLDLCNPHWLYYDPEVDDFSKSSFWAEKKYPRFTDLLPLFEAGVLDRSKKDNLFKSGDGVGSTAYSDRTLLARRQKSISRRSDTYVATPEIIEYYGPIPDKSGGLLEEHAHVIIANGKYVLKDGVNEYWDRKPPFYATRFNLRPFKASGAGIADNAVEQQKTINELMSMFLDILKKDAYSPYAVNQDAMVDPTQLDRGIRPNDIIYLQGDKKAQDCISEFPVASNIAPQVFQTIEFLKLSGQKGASVNTMTSNPASRARISAAEIGSNDQRRIESMNSLGMEIDLRCIEPIVRRVDQLILQFGFTDDNLELVASKGVLSQSEYELIKGIPSIDRFIESTKNYKILIRGFRHTMKKQDELRSAMELISQINMLPPQAQLKIQWQNVLPDIIEMYNFDPNRWISMNTPQDKAYEENRFLANDQAVAVGQQDDDMSELLVHYEGFGQSGGTQAFAAHIMMHIQRIMAMGGQPPPPPPEIAQALGLPAPGQLGGAAPGQSIQGPPDDGIMQ